MRTTCRGRRPCAGLTLVELLIVLGVLGVLASVAVTSLSGGRAQTASHEAAGRIAADIAFAQAEAMARHTVRIVTFDAAAEQYQLESETGVLQDPVSHLSFVVDLPALFPGAGVDLASPNFGGASYVRFEASGTPLAGGEVRLYAGGEGWRVCVADLTGRITVEGL